MHMLKKIFVTKFALKTAQIMVFMTRKCFNVVVIAVCLWAMVYGNEIHTNDECPKPSEKDEELNELLLKSARDDYVKLVLFIIAMVVNYICFCYYRD